MNEEHAEKLGNHEARIVALEKTTERLTVLEKIFWSISAVMAVASMFLGLAADWLKAKVFGA